MPRPITHCPRCHYDRTPEDTAPDYECPRCGVIYTKAKSNVENAAKNAAFRRQHRPPENRRFKIWIPHRFVVVYGFCLWGLLNFGPDFGLSLTAMLIIFAITAISAFLYYRAAHAAERRRQQELTETLDKMQAEHLEGIDVAMLYKAMEEERRQKMKLFKLFPW
ncbi:MAG: hypothetical protein HQL50_13790 [Magnetococcales bacterium]|nr:hypothetical protein [Magnetococcales bacterium]